MKMANRTPTRMKEELENGPRQSGMPNETSVQAVGRACPDGQSPDVIVIALGPDQQTINELLGLVSDEFDVWRLGSSSNG